MDITLTEEQELLARTALAFARTALKADRIRELEATEPGFDAGTWRQMAAMGWAGAVFPPEYGGADLGLLELALIVEALGQGAVPSPIFSTVIEAGLLLLDGGSLAQRRQWLPRIATGQAVLTTAVLEPHGGMAPAEIRTTIARTPAGFRIEGVKLFVRAAGPAEAILALGRTGEAPEDLTLLLVPRAAAGLRCQRLRAAGGETLWEVGLDGVMVPADAVVGEPGRAWPLIERLLLRGACLKAAELVGIGQAALDLTVSYAGTRVQFDRPIGSFQAVQHHCADMYRDLQACRLLVWQAAARLAGGRPAAREVAMAKAKASEAIPALTRMAHQIHGAIAYYRDYPLELYYHRALAAQAAYGDARVHRGTLARLIREALDRFRGDTPHELPVHYV